MNEATMRIKPTYSSSLLLFFLYYHHHSQAQESHTTGHTCTPNQTTYPCQTYAFYRAMAPDFLDLASIGDLFAVSRLMILNASNISFPVCPLIPNQSLFVPLTCSCNSLDSGFSLSYANLSYTIKSGDTFYNIAIHHFQNLTTYQSVEIVNPTLDPTNLTVGANAIFPIFCKCPNISQLQNQTSYLISYVTQPSDTFPSIASRFGSTIQSIININGENIQPFDVVFVPVSRIPHLTQPSVAPKRSERRDLDLVIGLSIGLGLCGLLLILTGGLWGYREALLKKRRGMDGDEEREQLSKESRKLALKEVDANLMADVSGCLDKYKVHGIEELTEATDGFDQRSVIQGSVYKGCIDGEFYAIKKMKWNAYEELKILQKVNHGNLVKLEGFCIDPEDSNCYLVYEYVENGCLHSWLHGNRRKAKLNWKTRLRIAIDIANGLQYIHEHTRPQVVHKDIKSSNILLDANMRAKIANFGLAKTGCNAITMHIVGTQGYIAPEYLAKGVVSTKVDVFSFGVVLLELVSGREAIDEEGKLLSTSVNGVLNVREEKEKRVKAWMDAVLLEEEYSMESVMNVMVVAIACLHRDPSKRPSMVDIVYALCKRDDLFFDASEVGLTPRQAIAR